MKKVLLVFLLALALLVLSSCDNASTTQDLLTLTPDEFPRIDGSTATIPLGEATAAILTDMERSQASRFANFSGTDNSFWNIIGLEADLLIVYEPSEQTVNSINMGVITIDDLNMQPIGRDGLVFIVNASNPIDNLTTNQIRDIYAGLITNWNEIGGADAPIEPFQRNLTAGSHALMISLLMQDTPLVAPPQHLMFSGMGGLLAAVAEFDSGQYAIGYNVFYYVTEMMNNPDVKVLSVDGVAPTRETIANGEYPLTNYFYAVIRDNERTDSAAYKVFEWLQSPEGQALINAEGYAAINPPR
ncbi:MAG: substrate-binding domain-containing protein [Defluviitaleaceae bacterium]|nr:substrate-binding domain-containing protein [Defluviitaleaceae bacterium]